MTVPLYQTVAYPFEDAREAAAISNPKAGFTYGRWDNPTVQVFEKRNGRARRHRGCAGDRFRHGCDLHPDASARASRR